jgi:hypothetical protein
VSKLGRLWDWLLPGLIYLDPMVATAYGLALLEDQPTQANAVRRTPVSDASGSLRLTAIGGTPAGSPGFPFDRRHGFSGDLRASFVGSDVSRASTRTGS